MLTAQDISLTLRGKIILDRVDFAARPGEVTAIVGPNGSGKTTLLKVLTGEERGTGLVRLNRREVTPQSGPALAAMRGVLPQASRLAFPFKVIEVIRIGHRAGPHATDPVLPDRALAAVGLPGFGDRFYQDLSGGEQQRVQLARVLTQAWQPVFDGAPCWLFLDEPVASLDIGHQLGVMQLVRDYADRGGGVVTVMHDLNLTALHADRVTLMQHGRVLASGTPDAVLTDDTLSSAYGCRIRTGAAPAPGMPFILPQMVVP